MDLQYISNESGEKTAVVIPIEEWKQITDKHQDLKHLGEGISEDNKVQKRKPSEYRGIISKEDAQNMHSYLKQARDEWTEIFDRQ